LSFNNLDVTLIILKISPDIVQISEHFVCIISSDSITTQLYVAIPFVGFSRFAELSPEWEYFLKLKTNGFV